MAGDWIKMRTNLWDDPRISKLCDITDHPEAAIVGGLYWLWATADEHTDSGILPGLTTRAIDRKTGVNGLGQGLVDIGWLADHPEGVRIVGFEEHNGTSAKKRCQTAKRVEKHKAGNAPVTQQALPEIADGVSDALPREEKRREEVNQKLLPTPDGADQPTPKISYVKIAEIYNKTCGAVLPKCEALNAKRKTNIRNLCALKIRGGFPFRDAEFWEGYFNDCLTNQHWIGNNDRGWRADLEFLTRTDIALKVLEAA